MSEIKKELYFILKKFAQGVRTGNFDKSVFNADVETNCYHTGAGKGIERTVELLSCPQIKAECVKQNVENVITRWKAGKAQQSFHLHQLFVKYSDNKEFHYVQYGGTYVLSYIQTPDGWKISKILFDLCWLDGNSYWVSNWKMIEPHFLMKK